MNDVKVSELAEKATRAALAVIDSAVPNAKKSGGPLGDKLAAQIDNEIRSALYAHQAKEGS